MLEHQGSVSRSAAHELGNDRSGALEGARPLEALLRRWRGVIADVARETGRSRKQVYRWIEEHALDVASYRD